MQTLLFLAEEGYKKNTTGICTAKRSEDIWIETSVEDFRRKVDEFALGLYDLGIRKGDRVALHAENSTEWIICDLGILSLGAITVPIYATQPGAQIEYILNDAEAKIYIVSSKSLYDSFHEHLDKVPSLVHTIGLTGAMNRDMLDFASVLEAGRRKKKAEPDLLNGLKNAVKPDDLASFIYTSGTTGNPKGVMLTHYNIASNVIDSVCRMPFDPEKDRGHRMLSYLPLSHIFERMITFMMLYIGYPIYYIPGIDRILDDFKHVRPLHFSTVPRLLEKIYTGIKQKADSASGIKGKLARWAINLAESFDIDNPPSGLAALKHRIADKLVFGKMRDIFGGNLIGVTSGGAALSPRIMNFFNGIGIHSGQGYGLTETSPVITVYEPWNLRGGSVGKPIARVEVKLEPVEGYDPDKEGEIVVRGPNIMKGYYNAPEKTAEVLTDDGWFHTGDIGRFDETGNLFITDRKKELLKLSTGKYIAPSPIEDALALSVMIEQAVVIGNFQKFCTALIVPNIELLRQTCEDRGVQLPETEWSKDPEVMKLFDGVINGCNKNLPHWEQIKKFHLIETPFTVEGGELTPTLKRKRRVIQAKYSEAIEAMYD